MSKNIWHRRLGHPLSRVFYLITRRCNVALKNESIEFCQSCQLGKSHFLPFSPSESCATKQFDLIHKDVWGLAVIMSTYGFRYYMLFLDDFSWYIWIYPLRLKSDTNAAFEFFLNITTTSKFYNKIMVVSTKEN